MMMATVVPAMVTMLNEQSINLNIVDSEPAISACFTLCWRTLDVACCSIVIVRKSYYTCTRAPSDSG
jgi:hypothetical protein